MGNPVNKNPQNTIKELLNLKKALAATFAALMVLGSGVGKASAGTSFVHPMKNFRITQYASDKHMAIDYQSKSLDQAYVGAIESGKVVKVCRGYCSGWGYYVVVDHLNGYKSLYSHLSGISVANGQYVGKFSKIGNAGKTGHVTCRFPILHLEVYWQGVKIDPLGVIN